jgi:pantoate kinase
MKKATAFVPGHISGFFQVCEASDPERNGSRNCGPCVDAGVLTSVEVQPGERASIEIFINGKKAPEARTSLSAAEQVLRGTPELSKVIIKHDSRIPIGAGYGASGAGALGVALALPKALDIAMSRSQATKIAHVAEIECNTGLGDVGAQLMGGLVVGVEPGAPPYGKWQRIEVPADVKMVCGTLGQISTKDFLKNKEMRGKSERLGGLALKKLLNVQSLQNFMEVSREFAEELGLLDDELRVLIKAATSAGALGASQVMLGRAVFAPVEKEKLEAVKKAFLELLEPDSVIVASVDNLGARLV